MEEERDMCEEIKELKELRKSLLKISCCFVFAGELCYTSRRDRRKKNIHASNLHQVKTIIRNFPGQIVIVTTNVNNFDSTYPQYFQHLFDFKIVNIFLNRLNQPGNNKQFK